MSHRKIYVTESQMRKIVIQEYLDNDYNLPLVRYFQWAEKASDKDKTLDLIWECWPYVLRFIEDNLDLYYDDDEFREMIDNEASEGYIEDEKTSNALADAIIEENLFESLCYYIQTKAPEWEIPSWLVMEFNRIVKNEWCIHFGSDAYSIAKEGFTGGTEDMTRLAYTGAGRQKRTSGYDFAYSLKTNDNRIDCNGYGDEAVIFRTSGVEVIHFGDEEHQVIFDGKQAKDFIPIAYDSYYGDWVVPSPTSDKPIYHASHPSDIAAWVERNYEQYQRKILYGKNGMQPRKNKWGGTSWR